MSFIGGDIFAMVRKNTNQNENGVYAQTCLSHQHIKRSLHYYELICFPYCRIIIKHLLCLRKKPGHTHFTM
jgi:hypothetical protein